MSSHSLDLYPLSIAPMIQWTDRHWRYFMRLITQRTLLYTEMTMDSALVYNSGNLEDFIGHTNSHNLTEYPLAVCDTSYIISFFQYRISFLRFS